MKRDLLQQAFSAMRFNLRRTVLTMLGMAWGIATVVLLLAYGDGFGRAIHNIFESFGSKAVGVFPGRTSMQAGGNKAGTEIHFVNEDIELLRNVVPFIHHISHDFQKDFVIQNANRSFTFGVHGIDPSLQDIQNFKLETGRFLTEADGNRRARVCLLGSEAKEKLFSGMPAVGESIRVGGISFEVVGVMQPRIQEGDSDINRIVYMPFSSMDAIADTQYIGGIWLDYEGLDHERVTKIIRSSLAIAHNFKADDMRAVFVFDALKQLDNFNILALGLQLLLAFIGTLTLGIGGVGLMNIMLVSVTQRTREIGVEKALGARKKDILFQFLAEALVITALGGLLGIVLSFLVSYSVGTLTLYSAFAEHAEAGDIRLIIAPKILTIATLILAVVGVGSGMLPAIRAANLDPIEALHYE